MRGDYIDFISAYCDSWCERCVFTGQCSHYAVKIATAMCDGDVEVALELALGTPPPADDAERKQRQAFSDILEIVNQRSRRWNCTSVRERSARNVWTNP
jgi:hypothetical protein